MFLFSSYHRPYWYFTAYPKWPTFDFMAPSSLKGPSLSASLLEKGSLWYSAMYRGRQWKCMNSQLPYPLLGQFWGAFYMILRRSSLRYSLWVQLSCKLFELKAYLILMFAFGRTQIKTSTWSTGASVREQQV